MRIGSVLLALTVACSDSNTPRRPAIQAQNQSFCGDGVHGSGEVCDGDELGSATCESQGFGPGELACAANRCDAFDLSRCAAPEECGDSVLQSPELCDTLDLADESCESLGYTAGDLLCLENCGGFDTSQCGPWAGCGDNAIDGPEMCDGTELGGVTCAALGFESGALSCRSDCMALDTTGCVSACTPDCAGRECGPDPACGTSCGTCNVGTCNTSGRCEITDPAGPVVVDLGANIGIMTPTKTLIISAVVTDPDGIDDVIGGLLKDPVTGSTYGAFQTAAAEGAYSMSLLWDDIHVVNPIMSALEGTPRAFRAEFFDVAGHVNGQELEIVLDCDDSNEAACDGICTDVLSDAANCGACYSQCPNPGPGERRCLGGECVPDCDWSHHVCDQDCVPNSAVYACGTDCEDCPPAGPNAHRVCVSHECGQACDQDFHMCDDECFPDDSVSHCGYQCTSCFDPEHGDPICDRGSCEYTCDEGTLDCGGDCAPCPERALSVGCDGSACVATSCADTDLVCAGDCSECPDHAWSTACRYGECFPRGCSSLRVTVQGECVSFVPERIHIDGFSAGFYSDLVLDANDTPHIAHGVLSSSGPSRVEYRTRSGGDWSVETVVEVAGEWPGNLLRMVLAADGTPHLAYLQYDPSVENSVNALVYATRTAGGWTTEVVSPNVEYDDLGLVLDSSGSPVIAFETSQTVAVVRKATTGWQTLGALATGSKENIALAVDGDGDLRVAFETDGYQIEAAEWNGESWDTEVASHYSLASNIAYVFDASGTGHLVFRIVREGYNRAHHVRTGANGFEPDTDTVVSVDGLDSTNHLRMAEGSDDSLHVVHVDEIHDRLNMYQGWDDILPDEMDWQHQRVTYDEPAVVSPPAIAVDSQDRIHLTYHDADARDLIYSVTAP